MGIAGYTRRTESLNATCGVGWAPQGPFGAMSVSGSGNPTIHPRVVDVGQPRDRVPRDPGCPMKLHRMSRPWRPVTLVRRMLAAVTEQPWYPASHLASLLRTTEGTTCKARPGTQGPRLAKLLGTRRSRSPEGPHPIGTTVTRCIWADNTLKRDLGCQPGSRGPRGSATEPRDPRVASLLTQT